MKELEPTEQLLDMKNLYKKEEREVSRRVLNILYRLNK